MPRKSDEAGATATVRSRSAGPRPADSHTPPPRPPRQDGSLQRKFSSASSQKRRASRAPGAARTSSRAVGAAHATTRDGAPQADIYPAQARHVIPHHQYKPCAARSAATPHSARTPAHMPGTHQVEGAGGHRISASQLTGASNGGLCGGGEGDASGDDDRSESGRGSGVVKGVLTAAAVNGGGRPWR